MIADNTILHGDQAKLIKQIDNATVDLILTDCPYGMDKRYGRSNLGSRTVQNDDNLDWLDDFAKECYRVLKNNRWCIVMGRWETESQFIFHFRHAGFELKTEGIWDKGVQGLGEDISEGYENIYHFRKGNAKTTRFRSNVYRYTRVSAKNGRPEHPHEKPLQLMESIIIHFTNKNDLVLDPFCGSGVTGKASAILERRYIMFDIEEEYYNLAKDNINQLSIEPEFFNKY